MKRVIICVTSDLVTDNRVDKVCTTLYQTGFEVLLVGRRYGDSPVLLPRAYPAMRMRLLFRKGFFFYAEYNLRLFFLLLFSRENLILANDSDTLPAAFFVSKLKLKPLIYDSHEYYTEVPELIGHPKVKRFWERIEKFIIPKVDAAYTVCRSIADVYSVTYGIPFAVVRNVPHSSNFRLENIDIPIAKPFIIYQGVLNMGRGLEEAIRAMQFLPEVSLLIAGSGSIEKELRNIAENLSTQNVYFAGRLRFEELSKITPHASLGISLEKDLGLNYRFALPNKLFDYIQAKIPVVVSNLPEMKRLVEDYNIGLIAHCHDTKELAKTFRKALSDKLLREQWTQNLEIAATKLTWENEEIVLKKIFEPFL